MPVTREQLEALGAPTPTEEIKQRPVFNKAKVKVGELDYVDARFVMERFDTVLGPENWQDLYRETPGGIVGRIGVLVERPGQFVVGGTMDDVRPTYSEWVWKEDVGTESTIEATKGSFSDAFKRAAVKWGVARDLYDAREEDRSEPAGQRPLAAGGTASSPATGASSPARGSAPRPFPVDPATAPWVCPEHGAVVAFPAGTSASTGRAYAAFYACPEGRECPHRAPRGLRVLPAHLIAQAESEDDSGLPF